MTDLLAKLQGERKRLLEDGYSELTISINIALAMKNPAEVRRISKSLRRIKWMYRDLVKTMAA